MSDPLLDLLLNKDRGRGISNDQGDGPLVSTSLQKYISRLLSLRPSDLATTETQSLAQSSQSNALALQALSSRSHRSTTASSDRLSTLHTALPTLVQTVADVRIYIPQLDESATAFAAAYSRSRPAPLTGAQFNNNDKEIDPSSHRKQSTLLSRQAPSLQELLDLPSLLSTAIASAASSPSSSANYGQALDLYAHIKRLAVLYPDSHLVADVQIKAEHALKDMTTNLLTSLRGQNVRLAAAIRAVGWLRRIVPELSGGRSAVNPTLSSTGGNLRHQTNNSSYSLTGRDRQVEERSDDEGSFGALFLAARLTTFLSMTEDALAPLRDLADQETERRLQAEGQADGALKLPHPRRPSSNISSLAVQGQQTERYLKRYVEIFREQSFGTIQMYKNIFPVESKLSTSTVAGEDSKSIDDEEMLRLPSALATFPLHLVSLLMETLQTYLPNIRDLAVRESLLVQVLYAANSLGRLGADFSMLISSLDLSAPVAVADAESIVEGHAQVDGVDMQKTQIEPEWYRVIRKHRVQAARLDAMAAGQETSVRGSSTDITVK